MLNRYRRVWVSSRACEFLTTSTSTMAMPNLSPIFRLPSDVLVEIFCLARDLTIESQLSAEFYRPFPPHYNGINNWITISQVCHVWRETALNTPLLWNRIYTSTGRFRWAEEMLRRSKQCLFTFIGTSDLTPNSDRVIRDLKNHLRRCRVLGLDRFKQDHLNDLFTNDSAPYLEILIAFFHGYSPSFTLNDAFLQREPLRHLEMLNGRLDWDAKFLQYLTHLRIRSPPPTSSRSFNKFVAVLSSIRNLEVLVLSGWFWIKNIDTPPVAAFGNRKVYLQRLKYFEMLCFSGQAACFFGGIMLPTSCKIRLEIRDSPLFSEDSSFVLSWLSDRFQSPTSSRNAGTESENHLQSLCLGFYGGGCRIQGFCDVVTHDKVISGWESPFVDLHTTDLSNDEIRQILDFLPVDRLTFLDIPFGMKFSKSFWVEVFGSIPTLKSIFLNIYESHFFAGLIPDSSNPAFIPFPALSSVTLTVPTPLFPPCAYDSFLINSILIDSFLMGAIKRLEMGSPIQELFFSGEHTLVPDDVLTQLARVVPHVGIHSPSQR
jgi:hypothetical protein